MGSKPPLLFGLLLGTAAVLAGGQAFALESDPIDRVIVEWAPQTSAMQKQAARTDVAATDNQSLGRRFETLSFDSDDATREALAQLRSDPHVLAVSRDHLRALQFTPNDPDFDLQWGLQNTGQPIATVPGTAGADISAVQAWDRTTGDPDTVVAVIDSGFRFAHPDLKDRFWSNPADPVNGLDDDKNGLLDDYRGWDFSGFDIDANPLVPDNDPTEDLAYTQGHGVHVAGIIAGTADNAVGISGVAPESTIMPLRVCGWSAKNNQGACPVSAIVAAINYAGKHGVRVANLSLGGYVPEPTERDALAANPKTLYVVAAGNEMQNVDSKTFYPCAYDPSGVPSAVDNVVCVAATTNSDEVASFSNYGKTTVDLAAPGNDVFSSVTMKQQAANAFGGLLPLIGWTNEGWKLTSAAPLTSQGLTNDTATQSLSTSRSLTAPGLTVTAPTVCIARWWEHGKIGKGESFSGTARVNAVQTDHTSPSGQWTGEAEMDARATGTGSKTATFSFTYTRGNVATSGTGVWIDDYRVACQVPSGQENASSFGYLSGTSMASPQVAGAAALLASYEPKASVTQLRTALLNSVDPVAALNPTSGSRPVVSGGRLNVDAALAKIDSLVYPDRPTITQGPAANAPTDSATFVFTTKNTTAPVTYECALDDAVMRSCQSPVTLSNVPAGSRSFKVTAVDTSASRNHSLEANWSWTSPGPPPDTAITSTPAAVGTESTATFVFSSPKPGATFQCAVGRAAYTTCTSPRTLTGLGIGSHTFAVRALDAFNRPDPSPAHFAWDVLDTRPPETAIDSSEFSNVTGAGTVTFSSPDFKVTFECAFDTRAYGACASPVAVTASEPGPHSFNVRAKDGLGRVDASPARVNWEVLTPDNSPAPTATQGDGAAQQQPPGAVGKVGVKRKRTSARLRWAPVAGANRYTITRSGAKPQTVSSGAATLRKLKAGRAYKVLIAAVNAAGSSDAVRVTVPKFRR